MEYQLRDEINMLRQAVREFVDKAIASIARAIDEEERVPFETLKQAGELGFLGIPFPEEYGGLDMGIVGYCVLPLERMYRDARVFRIYEGTNQIQRYVIASEILKKHGHKIRLA